MPYVHLFLESASRHFPGCPILVADDCSPDFPHLTEVARRYGAAVSSSPHRLGHNRGDVACFLSGLFWARSHGYDFLVKMSRRFIPLYDWRPELTDVILATQYATYSNQCVDTGIGFRTECVALHVATWFTEPVVFRLRHAVIHECGGLVEAYIHDIARLLHGDNCEFNKQYEAPRPRPQPIEAYKDWPLLGSSRIRRTTEILWHHHSSAADYHHASEKLGLKYGLSYFLNIVSG